MEISGHKTRSVFDRYNIVSERELHEAARKVSTFISEAEKLHDGDKTGTMGQNGPNPASRRNVPKLLN